jgi:succinoglycan biosynthesis protein ExoA
MPSDVHGIAAHRVRRGLSTARRQPDPTFMVKMPKDAPTLPFLTLVLPTLNEELYLERCLRSLLDDPYPRDRLEILVVDGGSSDSTVAIGLRLEREFSFLRILHNPRRLQSAAFNIAMRAADPRAEVLMRCDVHAEYPAGFLTRGVQSLETSGAAVATYADAPKSSGCFQAAVAFAQNTPLGVGNAWYRLGGTSRFVEHGKHGCFRRDAVEAVGGYDESFSHNEDSELSLRLIDRGGKVWLDAGLTVHYYPRASPAGLMRQYFLYGRGRAQTIRKHRIVPRLRQLAPVLLVLGEATVLALAPLAPALLLAFPAYAALLVATALYGAARTRNRCVLLAPLAFAIMHHCWGLGFLGKMLETSGPRRPRRSSVTSPSPNS